MPTGGAILSKRSADGCVFSNPAWPDVYKDPNYDINNILTVSKIIKQHDNEYQTILIAQQILGVDSKHILQALGETDPEEKDVVARDYDSPGMKDNLESLAALKISQANDPARGACYALAKSENMDNYKMLISVRYTATLIAYAYYNRSEKHIATIVEAAGPFIDALNTLAIRKDGDSLVNLDLHSENIFVNLYNTANTNNINIGMADFGRCMIYKKTSPINNQTWIKNFVNYCYSVNLRDYPAVSLEVRLFSYMLKADTYNFISEYKTNEGIHLTLWYNFINHMENNHATNKYPSKYFLINDESSRIAQSYGKFIKHVLKHIDSFMEIIKGNYDENNEIEELIQFMYLRTAGIGFVGTLLSVLPKNDIDIATKVDKFIDFKPSFEDDLYSRVLHVYALELFAPYNEDHSIHTLYMNETLNRCYKTYINITGKTVAKANTTRKRGRNAANNGRNNGRNNKNNTVNNTK